MDDPAVGADANVRGLDVAMQPASRECSAAEAPRELDRGVREAPETGCVEASLGAAPDVLDEVEPVDELHGEEARVVPDDEIVELNEVRVDDPGERSELVLEPMELLGPRRLERHLDAELAIEDALDGCRCRRCRRNARGS